MRTAPGGPWIFSLICILGLLPGACLAQAAIGGNATVSGNATLGGGVVYAGTWSDLVRRATLAVGTLQKDQKGVNQFTTGGAAIIIRDSRDRCFIATALHVFYNPSNDPSKNWVPESLQIRGWRDEQKSRYSDLGSTLPVRSHQRPLYVASIKFDLAIVPATQEIVNRLLDGDQKLATFDPTTIAENAETYDGADVLILGFPSLVGEEYQQRALMRAGIIAWTDSSDPSAHEFLVDSRIFPGNSGGPVLSSAAGMNRDASISSGKRIKLIGIVSKTINAKPELALGMSLPDEAMVIGAAGVGVIEPAHELLELMAQFR
ncbi:MAG: trypsin-like peptidase domain-containing protein [Acidobacteriaceae bacterium]